MISVCYPIRRYLVILGILLMMSGCTTKLRNENLEHAAKDWAW